MQAAATMRETITGLGRKEASWSLDLSVSWGAEDAVDVEILTTVEGPLDVVGLD